MGALSVLVDSSLETAANAMMASLTTRDYVHVSACKGIIIILPDCMYIVTDKIRTFPHKLLPYDVGLRQFHKIDCMCTIILEGVTLYACMGRYKS